MNALGEQTIELRVELEAAQDLVEQGLVVPRPVMRAPEPQALQFIIDGVNTASALLTVAFSVSQAGKVAKRMITKFRDKRGETIAIVAKREGRVIGSITIAVDDEEAVETGEKFIRDIINQSDPSGNSA